jgi:hypothetical protein
MNNGCQLIAYAEQHWNMDPEDKEACKGLGKEERTKSVLCLRMGNTIPKRYEEEQGTRIRK